MAWAGVEVFDAWARATMPGQKVAGVYMQLRSDVQARLVGVRSDAARTAEVHQMSHEGGVMRMRRLESLDLPAGKTVTRAFEVYQRCFEKGVLIRTTGDIIALSPPLIVSKAQIDEMVGTLATVLKEVAK